MDAYEVRFLSELQSKLKEKIVDCCEKLAHPAAPDYAAYKERVGVINGLKAALEISNDIEQSLRQPEADGVKKAAPARQRYES